MAILEIINLHVNIDDTEILHGINLTCRTGEIHAIMGPNGNGKSTLLSTIMGNPKFVVTKGEILLDGNDVLKMSVDERSKAGLFLAMQYPSEIPGVVTSDFLRAAMNARSEQPISLFKFIKTVEKEIENLHMDPNLSHRYVNDGFSGGEKKRNEILQMKLLQPTFALIDEIDSGLDVDALKIVASSIQEMVNESFGCLMISHYQRLYELVPPTHVHVLIDGNLVASGDRSIIQRIDNEGYKWLKEFKTTPTKRKQPIRLDSCGKKESKV